MNRIHSKRTLLLCFLLSVLLLIIIYVMIINSRMQVKSINQINTGLMENAPAFSPKGETVAFFQEGSIIISNLDGLVQEHFTIENNVFSNIQWLSDSEIIYVREAIGLSDNPDYLSQFWVLDTETGETYPIDDELVFHGWIDYFSVSSSKTHVAFARPLRSNNKHELFILDLENGQVQSFPSPSTLANCQSPAWSPDDSRILSACPCYTIDDQNCSSQIWLFDINTGSSDSRSVERPLLNLSLSPDGQWLIYVGLLDTVPPTTNFYMAPVNKGIPNINRSYRLDFSENSLANEILGLNYFELPPSHATWSPDSMGIMFTGNLRTDEGFMKGVWYIKFLQ